MPRFSWFFTLRSRCYLPGLELAPTFRWEPWWPAAEAQISLVIDPAEIAGHEPSVAVERLLGRSLIVEIPEHQARTAAADLTDFAGRRLDIRFVLPPDLDLEAGT